jgi:hypothetical protein
MIEIKSMKLQNKTTTTRLGGYLTAAVTCGTLASTASAAIVNLDISSIDGINGGVSNGGNPTFAMSSLSPGLTGSLQLYNNVSKYWGLDGDDYLFFATTANDTVTSPRNFSSGSLIGASANFESSSIYTMFRYDSGAVSPDFGAGSYIGFKSANNHYGYFEVTWQSAANTFEILSGAYEDQAGVGILAGAGASAGGGTSAVPEASTSLGLLALGAGGLLTRRRKQAA